MCNKRGLQKRSGYMLLPKVNDVWLPNCPSVSYTEPHYHGNSISMAIREELHTHIHTHTHAHTHIHTHAHTCSVQDQPALAHLEAVLNGGQLLHEAAERGVHILKHD